MHLADGPFEAVVGRSATTLHDRRELPVPTGILGVEQQSEAFRDDDWRPRLSDPTQPSDMKQRPGAADASPPVVTIATHSVVSEGAGSTGRPDGLATAQPTMIDHLPVDPLSMEVRGSDARAAPEIGGNRADTPRQVMSQLAEFSRRLPDGPVEVSLSPEELGRVRLSLQAAEGGMVVQIVAERSETLDLIRRNIDLLAQELKEQGYLDLHFSYGDGQTGQRDRSADTADRANLTWPPEVDVVAARPHMAPAIGLDIRM